KRAAQHDHDRGGPPKRVRGEMGGQAPAVWKPSRREARPLASSAFEKLETRGTLTKTKRFRPGEESDKAAHMVKLPKGAKPVNVSLPPKAQVAWRMFGKFVQARSEGNPELEDNLLKAHIRLRPEEYLALAWMNTTFAAVGAMASADVPVDVIFKELSKQTIYGEVAREAEWITRDTELLGLDILTALRKAAQRSPSSKFSDFLQGVVTTSTSGGQLKPYFLVKAEQFEKEDRLEMRKKMETLGMLAESFVTVVVAFPLFLVVIMAIMAVISKTGSG